MFTYNSDMSLFTSCCLNLTDSCNLTCKYCFVHQQPHFMSLETAKKCVEFLENNLVKLDKKFPNQAPHKGSITYFGGEPMLCWDTIIVPLTQYIKEVYPDRFNLTITTNGTLLSKERIDFLAENQIFPLLSIDGDKETQDYNRPCRDGSSSFDLIEPNIDYLLSKFPNVTFRATINQDMAHKVFDSYKYATQKGFTNFFITPNCREQWSAANIEILKQEIEKIYAFFFCCMAEEIEPMNLKVLTESFEFILRRDLEEFNREHNATMIERTGKRCGLGTTSASFGWDGKIYGCQEQDSYAGEDSLFYIGDIYSGIDEARHAALLTSYGELAQTVCEVPEHCGHCELRTLCQEIGCPSVNYDRFNNFHINPEILCLWQQIFFDKAQPIMRALVANNSQFFKKYLYEQCNYKYYWKEEDYYGMPKL